GGQLHVRWRRHRTGRAQDDGDRQQDQRRRDGGERQRRRQRRARREHVTAILFLRPYFRAVGDGVSQAGQGTRLGGCLLTARRTDAQGRTEKREQRTPPPPACSPLLRLRVCASVRLVCSRS